MGDNAAWSVRKVYLYLVCLITLVMVIYASVGLVTNVFEWIYPEPVPVPFVPRPAPGETPPITPEEEAERQAQQDEYQRQWNLRQRILNTVRNVAMIMIAGPIYLYHWRKIEENRRAAAQNTPPPVQRE